MQGSVVKLIDLKRKRTLGKVFARGSSTRLNESIKHYDNELNNVGTVEGALVSYLKTALMK